MLRNQVGKGGTLYAIPYAIFLCYHGAPRLTSNSLTQTTMRLRHAHDHG